MTKTLPILSALCTLSCLCVIAAHGAEEEASTGATPAKEEEGLIRVVVPDIDRLKQRFEASIYHQLWQDPAAERFRNEILGNINKEFERIQARDGVDVTLILKNLSSGGGKLIHIDTASPDMSTFQAYLTFNENGAQELMRWPALDDAPPLLDTKADEAFISEDGVFTLSRFDQVIVLADPDHIAVPAQVSGVESDIQLDFAIRDFISAMIDLAYKNGDGPKHIEPEDLKQLLGQYDQYTHRMTLKPGGIFEHIDFTAPEQAGVQPVDQSVLARIPDTALAAAAIGINGQELWQQQIKPVIELAAQENPNKTADEIMTEINNMLSVFGITSSIEEIFNGLDGTLFFSITPSAPFPAATIGLPRSESLDEFISALLLARFSIMRPPEGKIETITLRPGVPPLQLGLAEDYWVLSSDPVLVGNWIKRNGGGWDKTSSGSTALSKATDQSFLVGGMDTARVVNIGQSLLGLAALGARGKDQQNLQSLLQLLQKLQQQADPAYIVGTQDGTSVSYDIYSLVGSGPLLMIPGAVFARVQQQQRRARWRAREQQRRNEQKRREAEKEPDSVDDL